MKTEANDTIRPHPRPSAVDRPILRYYGGKWRLAPWIIRHSPPHTYDEKILATDEVQNAGLHDWFPARHTIGKTLRQCAAEEWSIGAARRRVANDQAEPLPPDGERGQH